MRLFSDLVPRVLMLSALLGSINPTAASGTEAIPRPISAESPKFRDISSQAGKRPGGGGYGSAADSDWTQNGADPGRSGRQALTGDLNAATVAGLRPAWTAAPPTRDEQVNGAIVIDGTLFRTSEGPTGQIRRFDAYTGADLGPIVDVPGRALGQLAAAGDTLVVESLERKEVRRFLAGYRLNGRPRWEIPLPEGVSGGFTVGAGLVLRSAGATLTAYRVADGGAAWSAALDGEPGLHTPVLLDGLVLQGAESGRLQAFVAAVLAGV
ncbi:PQQ-binding-like beta-propeller repeat protein, partial [Dactylosporangium sp. NPDC051485]|uniref:outer membrane protein assembly factor BamB family protein n=1 Tax=Dactylosporangium sp. NPDC051485 TaxID=3154846 RepID=UPI00342343A5